MSGQLFTGQNQLQGYFEKSLQNVPTPQQNQLSFCANVQYVNEQISGSGSGFPLSSDVSCNNFKITNSGICTQNGDLANKQYTDSKIQSDLNSYTVSYGTPIPQSYTLQQSASQFNNQIGLINLNIQDIQQEITNINNGSGDVYTKSQTNTLLDEKTDIVATQDQDMNNFQIKNISDATQNQDVPSLSQVQNLISQASQNGSFPLQQDVSANNFLIRDSPAPLLSGDLTRKKYIDDIVIIIANEVDQKLNLNAQQSLNMQNHDITNVDNIQTNSLTLSSDLDMQNTYTITNLIDAYQGSMPVTLSQLHQDYIYNLAPNQQYSKLSCDNDNQITIKLNNVDLATLKNNGSNYLQLNSNSGLEINALQPIIIDSQSGSTIIKNSDDQLNVNLLDIQSNDLISNSNAQIQIGNLQLNNIKNASTGIQERSIIQNISGATEKQLTICVDNLSDNRLIMYNSDVTTQNIKNQFTDKCGYIDNSVVIDQDSQFITKKYFTDNQVAVWPLTNNQSLNNYQLDNCQQNFSLFGSYTLIPKKYCDDLISYLNTLKLNTIAQQPLNMSLYTINQLADGIVNTDAINKKQLDQKNFIQNLTTNQGYSKITCSGDNQIDIKCNNFDLGYIYCPVGQSSNNLGILATNKLQMQSNQNSISVYGNKTIDTNIANLNTHGFYINGNTNGLANIQSLCQVSQDGVELNMAAGKLSSLIGGTKYCIISASDNLQLCGGLNPQSVDKSLVIYNNSNKPSQGVFGFQDKMFYTQSYTQLTDFTDDNQIPNKRYVDLKSSSSGGQSFPPSNNLAMGNFKFTGLAAGTQNGDSLRFEQLPTVQQQEFIYLEAQNIVAVNTYFQTSSFVNNIFSETQNTMFFSNSPGNASIVLQPNQTFDIQISMGMINGGSTAIYRCELRNISTGQPLLGTALPERSQIFGISVNNTANPSNNNVNRFIYQTGASQVSIGLYCNQNSNVNSGDIDYFRIQIYNVPNQLILQANSISSNNLTWNNNMNTSGYSILGLPATISDQSQAISKQYLDNQNFATLSNRLDQFAVPNTTVNFGGQRLTGLQNAVNLSDAVTYSQLQNSVNNFISNPMTQNLNCNNFVVSNLQLSTLASAAVRYDQLQSFVPQLIRNSGGNISVSFNGNAIVFRNNGQSNYSLLLDNSSGFSHEMYLNQLNFYNATSPFQQISLQNQTLYKTKQQIQVTNNLNNASQSTLLYLDNVSIGSNNCFWFSDTSLSRYGLMDCQVQYSKQSLYLATSTSKYYNFSGTYSTTLYPFQIGTLDTNPQNSYSLLCEGRVYATSYDIIIPVSQRDYKLDIQDFNLDLLQLQPKTYYYNQNKMAELGYQNSFTDKQTGYIVEDILECGFQQYIKENENGTKTIKLSQLKDDMLYFHQNKIREQQQEINDLKQQLQSQQQQIDQQQQQINQLFQIIQSLQQ